MAASPTPFVSENAATGDDRQRRSLAMRALERTATKQSAFLKALEELGTIHAACLASRVGRRTVYDWVENKRFADAFQLARDAAADVLEAEARRRGMEGVAEPVFFQGAVVGHITRYSDACLMALLSAYRPERFARRRAGKARRSAPGDRPCVLRQDLIWKWKPVRPGAMLRLSQASQITGSSA